MAFQVGDRVQIKASPVSVFEIVETDVDGNPERVLIQAEASAPGRYPFVYNTADLIAAE
ncbi:hypothetical protein [Nocardia vulneris]|uniref:hypothetical protein n=1 Tax=Nocardia vulneris TaxID=1141657 RepID=UPI0012E0AE42|nr:hypothetical protein [Nocardia vulneris]